MMTVSALYVKNNLSKEQKQRIITLNNMIVTYM